MTAVERISRTCTDSLLSLSAVATPTGVDIFDSDTLQLFCFYNRAHGKHFIIIPHNLEIYYEKASPLVLEFSAEEDALSYLESFLQDTATTLGSYN